MTTYIQFAQPKNRAFTFTAVFSSGLSLFASVPFNLYARRYYLQLTDNNNNVVVYTPLIESPDGYDFNLALPYSPNSIVFRKSSNNFEVS